MLMSDALQVIGVLYCFGVRSRTRAAEMCLLGFAMNDVNHSSFRCL